MSEQNILNPTNISLLNPDYGYTEGLQELRTMTQATSGKLYMRRQKGAGRIYQLVWKSRSSAVADQMRQWENQYRDDFFTLADWIRGRYFSGHFNAPLSFSPSGNEQYDIKGNFEELPTVNLYQYPGDPLYSPTLWGPHSIFLEEQNGFGDALVKLTGTGWTYALDVNAHGGAYYSDPNTNTTDKAEWVYFGYGCRIWSQRASNLGKFIATVTRVRDGATMSNTNLALNGDFELSASLPPPYWSVYDATLSYDTATQQSGSRSLVVTGTVQYAAAQTAVLPVEPGGTYTVSGYIRCNAGTSAAIQAFFADSSGAYISSVQPGTSATAWTFVSASGTAPLNAAQLVIACHIGSVGGGVAAFDKVSVVLDGSGTTVDLYSPSTLASAAVFEQVISPLDTYRVAITATNSKNSASSANTILADALEIMQ